MKCKGEYIYFLSIRLDLLHKMVAGRNMGRNVCVADCLSTNQPAVEITENLAAGLAVDGFANTHSCTESSEAFPWWVVDLGAVYEIGSVTITLPSDGGSLCNYPPPCFVQ